jgi:hypothetical protein
LRRPQALVPVHGRSLNHLRGAFARRSLVVASLLLGLVLALAILPFPSPFGLGPAGQ